MATAASASSARMMVGRHPILDRERRVFGYELLFRPSSPMDAAEVTPEEATARVISDTVLSFGLDTLTHGRRAFIKTPLAFLQHDVIKLLPPDRVVLQVPGVAEDEGALVEACRHLTRSGYTIALEDFTLTDRTAPLLALADFVKVDFLSTASRDPAAYRAGREHGRAAMIAGRVEKVEVFEAACREGFSHFQGFFFGEPIDLEGRTIPSGQVGYLRLLRALNNPNLSLNELEELVKHDASLCHRILRAVNSAGFAQRRAVTSMRDALFLLGRDTIRRWASLWVLAEIGAGAPAEVVVMASVRARFCEQLASRTGGPDASGEAFLLGMCSLLDVMLGRPMPVVLEELPLSPDVAAALLGQDNAVRRLLDCVIAYERGDWNQCLALAARAGVDGASLQAAYFDALRWAHELGQPIATSAGAPPTSSRSSRSGTDSGGVSQVTSRASSGAPAGTNAPESVARPGARLGAYELQELLGRGGMGQVYRAIDTRLGRTVALKVLEANSDPDSDRRRRFAREARAASALNHPNIITIFDVGEANGIDFLAMELVAGRSLDRVISADGLALGRAIHYAAQVAAALACAHAAGIVHRDVKPENVMVSDNGLVKILDFGIAKLVEESGLDGATVTAMTGIGMILGTVAYMSPEQAQGLPVDARSDVFSFGALLYEMLTWRRAFSGETSAATLAAVLQSAPVPMTSLRHDVPPDLVRLVESCLAKDRNLRPTTSDVVGHLEALRATGPRGAAEEWASPR